MNAGALLSCLDLVAKDLCESHAADKMLSVLAAREDRLAEVDCSEARFGIRFIERALALRIILAVARTLDRASAHRASFAQLLRLAADQDLNIAELEKRFDQLADGQAARKLRKCRNGFMAHTLVGELGSRDGMNLSPVSDLLYELTALYEDIHRVATNAEDRVVSEALEKWHRYAQQTWDSLFGVGPESDTVA